MPNPRSWIPSKAELCDGQWRASRNPLEVSYASRLITDLVVEAYGRQIRAHATGVLADIGCGKAPYFGMYREFVSKSVGVDWASSLHRSDQVWAHYGVRINYQHCARKSGQSRSKTIIQRTALAFLIWIIQHQSPCSSSLGLRRRCIATVVSDHHQINSRA